MKKFFTFVFCALCAVSVWGTEVKIIEVSDLYESTTLKAPTNVYDYNSLCQILYLNTDLGIDTKAGSITAISFKNACSNGGDRVWDIYMSNTTATKVIGFTAVADAQRVFTGAKTTHIVTIPKSADWYTISLDTPFEWDGTSNVLITILDKSTSYSGSSEDKCIHYRLNLTSGNNRVASKRASSGLAFDPKNPPTATDVGKADVPWIKFTIEEKETPITTPTINVSETELDFGSYYPEGETVSKTFTVTASDLTEDITFSAITGVSYNPTSIIKDNEALAGAGVEVKVTLGSGYTFPYTNPAVSVASTGATSKSVTLKATRVVDDDFRKPMAANFFNYSNAIVSPYFGYVYYNASTLTISEVTNNQFKPYSDAGFKVDYSSVGTTCEDGGKVTNLRGKFTSESIFKAFSFDYTAPEETGSIIIDENEDKSSTWPTEVQSNKSLTIKRTVVPDCWNTICLPTYLTDMQVKQIFGEDADVRSFTGANITSSSITLNFSEESETNVIEAGVPYLIKPTKAMTNPLNLTYQSFDPTPGSVDHDGICFEGVLVPTVIDGGDGSDYIIVGANNTLLHPTGEGTINGMRAYFHVIGASAKAALKTAKVSMNTGSTTELVLVKDNQTKPYKTMVNNQIVIVKEGQKVNIFGQTVK